MPEAEPARTRGSRENPSSTTAFDRSATNRRLIEDLEDSLDDEVDCCTVLTMRESCRTGP